jgi:hypothetical protein
MVNIDDIIKSTKSTIKFKEGSVHNFTFQQLVSINDEIQIPDIQVELNDDKVIEMMESYKKQAKFFVAKCLLTVAKLYTNNISRYYLVDGQHRFEAIKRLVQEDENINDNILLAIIPTNCRVELVDLFKELNIDSLKCPKLATFDWIIIEKLKDEIKKKYLDLPTTIRKKSNIYTVGEFLDVLQKKNILNVFNKKYELETDEDNTYVNEILKKLEKKNKEFFRKANYLEIFNEQNNDYNFQQSEKDLIGKHICMFFKKNNFIDWIVDNTLVPEHEKQSRITISDDLKNKIWYKEFEAKKSGRCPVWGCEKVLTTDISNSWHCGHIISIKNGGSNKLENFRPICPNCNIQMSDTNWDEYIDKIKKKYIIDSYFEDEEEMKCKKKGCKIKINKTNFVCVTVKEQPKPYCKTCWNT